MIIDHQNAQQQDRKEDRYDILDPVLYKCRNSTFRLEEADLADEMENDRNIDAQHHSLQHTGRSQISEVDLPQTGLIRHPVDRQNIGTDRRQTGDDLIVAVFQMYHRLRCDIIGDQQAQQLERIRAYKGNRRQECDSGGNGFIKEDQRTGQNERQTLDDTF